MKTRIPEIYLNSLIALANEYAERMSEDSAEKFRQRTFDSHYNLYYDLGFFFYMRLVRMTSNTARFEKNYISSNTLKRFSKRYYRNVIDDLISNDIIIENTHYSNFKNNKFCKSFLIHYKLIDKMNIYKRKFAYRCVITDIPTITQDIINWKDDDEADIDDRDILNRDREIKSKHEVIQYYSQLTYDMKALEEYCGEDEWEYNNLMHMMKYLHNKPKFVKGRFYHAFHRFGKEFREKVLLLDGHHIKEIFDVSGSDLHMLAKHVESENIPAHELLKFQRDVKRDFRSDFGKRKDGHCTEAVKKAFKIYFNIDKKHFESFHVGSIRWKIDQYFQLNFPSVREYVKNTENIWQICMDEEFDAVSINMVNYFRRRGIKALSCHDAIYVNDDVNVPNIKDVFYDNLNLSIDMMERLDNL